jgi:putative oxidoreductase
MPRLPGLQRGWGITVVRVMMGIILLIAGYQKFTGGVGAVAAGFEKIPIPLPWLSAVFISTLELVGGALLIVGLGVRWFGLVFALEHVVTTFWVQLRLRGWPNGRLELMLLAGGLMLFLAGPGKLALDAAWRGEKSPWRFWR